MKTLEMGSRILDSLHSNSRINASSIEFAGIIDKVSERDKFIAAKQILLGIAILYAFTIGAYLVNPQSGAKLIDIITITFPPITTLILAAYFRDKSH